MQPLNFTIDVSKTILKPYSPDQSCYDWSLNQHVTNYNNIETIAVMFVAGSLVMIVIYEFFMEHERLKPYASQFVYYAKLLLFMFFFMYFVVIKMRLYYYGI